MPFKDSIRELNRFRQIIDAIFKEGFGFIIYKIGFRNHLSLNLRLNKKKFETAPDSIQIRLRKIMEDLGGTFIKLGQLLSLRPDLIPKEYAKEFSKLQDQVPPFSYEKVVETIESELNANLKDVFLKFEKIPIASASIGQVHKAWLKDGKKVAVKVMRPKIEEVFETDIKILYQLAELLETHYTELKEYDLLRIVKEFERYTKNELDYTKEAKNLEVFYNNFKKDRQIVIPKVFHNYTTKRVLVMEFIDGKKINEVEKSSASRRLAVKLAMNSVLKQIFELRYFHADPHPGNIFILKGNKIAFLDLGIVGRISEEETYNTENLFIALSYGDRNLLADSLMSLGFVDKKIDKEQFKRDLSEHLREYYDITLSQLHISEFLYDLLALTRKYKIKLIPDFVLLVKAAATLEGFVKDMDPEFNFVEAWKKYAKEIIKKRKSIGYQKKEVLKIAYDFKRLLKDFPREARDFLSSHDRMKVDMEEKVVNKLTFKFDTAMNRIAIGIVIAALIIAATINFGKSESILNTSTLFLLIAVLLFIYLINSISREREV